MYKSIENNLADFQFDNGSGSLLVKCMEVCAFPLYVLLIIYVMYLISKSMDCYMDVKLSMVEVKVK